LPPPGRNPITQLLEAGLGYDLKTQGEESKQENVFVEMVYTFDAIPVMASSIFSKERPSVYNIETEIRVA
jgi:hypothetical protein